MSMPNCETISSQDAQFTLPSGNNGLAPATGEVSSKFASKAGVVPLVSRSQSFDIVGSENGCAPLNAGFGAVLMSMLPGVVPFASDDAVVGGDAMSVGRLKAPLLGNG